MKKPAFFSNPYLCIALCALAGTAADVLLKVGADQTAGMSNAVPWFGLTGLASWWVWAGIIFTILSLLAWMQALRSLPLNVAFIMTNVVHVLIPLSCWLFLGETLSARRLLGIGLVIAGLLVISKPFARLDSRL